MGPQGSVFLTCSQVIPMLLIPQTHFEKQGLRQFFKMRTVIQFIVEVSSESLFHFYIKKNHRYAVARAKIICKEF